MTLADFHKVFIGRMGEAGNEMEVREVVAAMATSLHARFPDVILSPDTYLRLANGEKYQPTPTPPVMVVFQEAAAAAAMASPAVVC